MSLRAGRCAARSRLRAHRALIGLLVGLVLTLSPEASRADIDYRTTVDGVLSEPRLQADLEATSQLLALQDKKAGTDAALDRRAQSDAERLATVLHAYGYWDGVVTYEIDTASRPERVHVKVESGPAYLLTGVSIVTPQGGPVPLAGLLTPESLGLDLGKPARSAPVVGAEPRIFQILAEHAHPLARVLGHRAVIDRATHTMTVTYTVDAGPEARFGAAQINGLDHLEPSFVEVRLGWQQGMPYDVRSVESTRQKLLDTGLFSIVDIKPAGEVLPDGTLPLTLALTEQPRRSVSVGLAYDTTEGVGGTVNWQHRNLFGAGERLAFAAQLGSSLSFVDGSFKIPGWRRPDQDLLLDLRGQYEIQDAYRGLTYTATASIERRLTPEITTGIGAQYERGNTTDLPEEVHRKYSLVGVPFYLRDDAVDDLLNPTRGFRAGLALTPYPSQLGSSFGYVYSRLNGSLYQRLGSDDSYVLAAYAAVGTDAGVTLSTLPKDKRLYAGGGGSVRGYGYQRAGPLDRYGHPIGGRSSFETGIELRVKVTDTIGVVPFLDAGTVYNSPVPQFGRSLFFGPGIGLRYYTAFGPVRLDVATPLRKRRSDSPAQLYVSLGQAF